MNGDREKSGGVHPGALQETHVADAERISADIGNHAPALLPLLQADPSLADGLTDGALSLPISRGELLREASQESESGLSRGLRRVRHRTMIRIALREVRRLADVDQTAAELAHLASACLEVALRHARAEVASRFGDALDSTGTPIPFVVMGMGKLGGGELNLGSDVDICFFYGTDEGETTSGETTVHDFFTRVARKVSAAIGDVDEHGFVFRVDLRLRPEGTQGPLVNSLASAERYYESFGRPWERAVWLRARPVAGDRNLGRALRKMLRPFIFPRRVDPSIARDMHEMVEHSRRQLSTQPGDDVKLGRGGIREAEFFVQALQLVWGGRHRSLRVSGTIAACARLEALGFISAQERERFEAGWALLRRVEHRIHMVTGYQTHDLPRSSTYPRFAVSLGFVDDAAMRAELDGHRKAIAALFDSLVETPEAAPGHAFAGLMDACIEGNRPRAQAMIAAQTPLRDTEEAVTHLMRWAGHPNAPLGPLGRREHPGMAEQLLAETLEAADPDLALRQLTAFLSRGGNHYARLLQDPRLMRRLIGVLGAGPALAAAIIGFPESLEGLLAGALLPVEEVATLHAQGPTDLEACVAFLRQQKRVLSLQIALAQISGEVDAAESEARLTHLADCQVALAFRVARYFVGVEADMAVVAMGKLGSGELGFGSDLDLLFVHDADDPFESARCAKAAQKLMHLLSCTDAEGPGYAIDTRLRPSGSQGTLVASVRSFSRYHEERAEGWERQALVRARVLASTRPSLAADIEALIHQHGFARGEPNLEEVARLRGRMEHELAGEDASRYHPKLGYGALVDIEFIAQCLQMKHGEARAERHTEQVLRTLEKKGLLEEEDARHLRNARRFFLDVERALHLFDPGGPGRLQLGGPRAVAVARLLGLRARDGQPADETLRIRWERLANQTRQLFDRLVAPVASEAPWHHALASVADGPR